jgi:hypothetical protein
MTLVTILPYPFVAPTACVKEGHRGGREKRGREEEWGDPPIPLIDRGGDPLRHLAVGGGGAWVTVI